MGKKKKDPLKVVIDTNVLVSALIFGGILSNIADLWRNGRITPFLSRDTFEELRDVLLYPKFKLTEDEIKSVIEEEILPCFEVVEVGEVINGVCSDADDDKFLTCAIAASADFIVTGDNAFLSVEKFRSVRIIKASGLIEIVQQLRNT